VAGEELLVIVRSIFTFKLWLGFTSNCNFDLPEINSLTTSFVGALPTVTDCKFVLDALGNEFRKIDNSVEKPDFYVQFGL